MSVNELDPGPVAASFRQETRADVEALARDGKSLKVVGLLGQREGPAATYAKFARKGFESVGIDFDLQHVGPESVSAAVAEANVADDVDGIFLYYPLANPIEDRWLRELVDPRKDIEGMHSFWSRLLYENQRFVDEGRHFQAILPCTPLAIIKLLERAGVGEHTSGLSAPLEGVTACVINRSEVVGKPLAAMLANDGAVVHSLDINGALTYAPAISRPAHEVRESSVTRAQALASADVVISAVPSKDFERIRADELKAGVVCVDVAEFSNFDDTAKEFARAFVPRVGPLTIAMAARNLVRLATGVRQ